MGEGDRGQLIAEHLSHLKRQMGKAQLVAISKNHPYSDIELAHRAGQRHFGESKVQELGKKASLLSHLEEIHWHFVGHLQSNKIGLLLKIPGLRFLHSVDSLHLLKGIFKRKTISATLSSAPPLSFFLQANTSLEREKKGFTDYDSLVQAVDFIQGEKSKRLSFLGLMTISKIRTDHLQRDAQRCFAQLKQLKNRLEGDFSISGLQLSMGMTRDYPMALREGSDFVRIGHGIFGHGNIK